MKWCPRTAPISWSPTGDPWFETSWSNFTSSSALIRSCELCGFLRQFGSGLTWLCQVRAAPLPQNLSIGWMLWWRSDWSLFSASLALPRWGCGILCKLFVIQKITSWSYRLNMNRDSSLKIDVKTSHSTCEQRRKTYQASSALPQPSSLAQKSISSSRHVDSKVFLMVGHISFPLDSSSSRWVTRFCFTRLWK